MRMIYMFWAVLIGVLIAIQSSTNTALRLQFNSPWVSAITNFAVGIVALSVIILIIKPETFSAFKPIAAGQVPLWKLIGGVLGAIFVVSMTVLVPYLGIGRVMILYLFGMIVMSAVIDHFGLFGMPMDKISLPKAIGIACLIVGVILTQKK